MEEFWIHVFPNYGPKICCHYVKTVLISLSLTCKILNTTYQSKIDKYDDDSVDLCNICHYRPKRCAMCIQNNSDKCELCTCTCCNMTTYLIGGNITVGRCKNCFKIVVFASAYNAMRILGGSAGLAYST